MKTLTERQGLVLGFIDGFIDERKYPPTIREIAGNFDISVKGAYDHVKALEKKGYIKCDNKLSRSIEIVGKDGEEELIKVPVIGNVAAGVPLLAEENYETVITVPASRIKGRAHFALRVRGDSMQDAGILDGDTAIFEQRQSADNGDIVVARINDEAVTLKRYFREKNRIKLKAENPVYPPIYTQNVRILGKLQCIIREYL
jgi:repressor LexA